MWRSFGEFFKAHFRYGALCLCLFVVLFVLTLLLPQLPLLLDILPRLENWSDKFSFIFGLFGLLQSNNSIWSALILLTVTALAALNITLLVFYIRKKQGTWRNSGKANAVSLAGMLAGTLGIGCAACGSVVIVSVLSFFGASGLLALLPFKGQEFGMLGIVLLLFSILYLHKKISEPNLC